MTKYADFIFEDYSFDDQTKTLELKYSFDGDLEFREIYKFDFPFADNINKQLLDRALYSLFIMAGISYFKAYLPKNIVIKKPGLDKIMSRFFSKTYRKGLGEFFYTNNLDPDTKIEFPYGDESTEPIENSDFRGSLIAIGGGKDSLVSIELMRKFDNNVYTWSLNHKSQLEPLVKEIGTNHFWIERTLDPKLLELNNQGALNGHIPISAIFACVGMVVAALTNKKDIVVSNEQSANEETLQYQGVSINHQYSKTLEFEKDFQAYLSRLCGESIRYYSLLRPFSELRIAELFAETGFEKYKNVFSSCNKAFTHDSDHMYWCGVCPKCAFVFLALTPFIAREDLEKIWGKNLLLDPSLEPTYRNLLGIDGDKPLECVGEVKESRAAMRLAEKTYPELKNKYNFELPDDYDFRSVANDEMPESIREKLLEVINSLSPLQPV